MNLGLYFSNLIEENDKVKSNVAKKIGLNPRTFLYKLERDNLSAYDLISLSKYFNLDLNDFKLDDDN